MIIINTYSPSRPYNLTLGKTFCLDLFLNSWKIQEARREPSAAASAFPIGSTSISLTSFDSRAPHPADYKYIYY